MKNVLIILILSSLHLSIPAQNIFRTACQGNLARLDSMLSTSSIDIRDNRGRSLLHWAVACKKKEVFDFLVDKGLNVNSEDHLQEIPMHIAIQFNNEKYFDWLIDAQPNDNWKSKYGGALLEEAVLKKNKAFIKNLVESGIDVNSLNNRGSTALEISMRTGATEVSELLLTLGADETKVRSIKLKGKYMGQPKPGKTPRMFAPDFISTEEYEFGSVFNASGNEFYYGVDVNGKPEIRYSKRNGKAWSKPETILSHDRYGYNDPFLSPDENRLYFISKRALDGAGDLKDHDIWYVERQSDGWSEPINAGANINSEGNEYYISFTQEGTMYFSSNKNAPEERKQSDLDIYYSKSVNGEFQKAVSLSESINTTAYEADVFVDPKETYLIFCSTRPGGLGRGDLYISFKKPDGTWTKAINMGETINTVGHELCPFVTNDGKYLLYTSKEDIYWVSTKIIDDLRKKSMR